MAEVGITAIVVGAILFALGLFPGLLPPLMERFEGLRDHFFRSRRGIHRIQAALLRYGDVWLLAGGGVMLIVGLLALLEK